MKLFLAAPDKALPSLLTALLSQESILHFFTKLFLAAPESAFPSSLTAWVSQEPAAIAELTANVEIRAAKINLFIGRSSESDRLQGNMRLNLSISIKAKQDGFATPHGLLIGIISSSCASAIVQSSCANQEPRRLSGKKSS